MSYGRKSQFTDDSAPEVAAATSEPTSEISVEAVAAAEKKPLERDWEAPQGPQVDEQTYADYLLSLPWPQRMLLASVGVAVSLLLVFLFWQMTKAILRSRNLAKGIRNSDAISQPALSSALGNAALAAEVKAGIGENWLYAILAIVFLSFGYGAFVSLYNSGRLFARSFTAPSVGSD